MSRFLIIFLVLSSAAYAEDLDFPSVGAGKYSDAVNKAIKAASIQTGAQEDMNRIKSIATDQAKKAGDIVVTTVTPFKPKDVYLILGTGYALGVKKEFKKSFKNPLFPNVTNTIEYSGKDGRRTSLLWGVSF